MSLGMNFHSQARPWVSLKVMLPRFSRPMIRGKKCGADQRRKRAKRAEECWRVKVRADERREAGRGGSCIPASSRISLQTMRKSMNRSRGRLGSWWAKAWPTTKPW